MALAPTIAAWQLPKECFHLSVRCHGGDSEYVYGGCVAIVCLAASWTELVLCRCFVATVVAHVCSCSPGGYVNSEHIWVIIVCLEGLFCSMCVFLNLFKK